MIKENKKGNVTFYFVFTLMAFIILIAASLLAPLGVRMSSEYFLAGERLMNSSINKIDEIGDAEVRAELQGILTKSRDAAQTNIEINSGLFQYAWILIIVLTGIVIFLFSRATVEQARFGGGFV